MILTDGVTAMLWAVGGGRQGTQARVTLCYHQRRCHGCRLLQRQRCCVSGYQGCRCRLRGGLEVLRVVAKGPALAAIAFGPRKMRWGTLFLTSNVSGCIRRYTERRGVQVQG